MILSYPTNLSGIISSFTKLGGVRRFIHSNITNERTCVILSSANDIWGAEMKSTNWPWTFR